MRTAVFMFLLVALSCPKLEAQIPEKMEAQKEHKWLKQFTGKWTVTSQPESGDGEVLGQLSGEMHGEFWLINRHTVQFGGTNFSAIQTLGYDSRKKSFVGTWVDTIDTHIWHYKGKLDTSGKKLLLTAKGPEEDSGKVRLYRDSYEFLSEDKIQATSEMQGDDGKWTVFMTSVLKRKK